MQIVIDVPEKLIYEGFKRPFTGEEKNILISAIGHGTPLPKGHGRILDEKDILDNENNDGGWYDLVDMPEYIAGVKSIIEADNTESEEKHDINTGTPDNSGDNDSDGSAVEVES